MTAMSFACAAAVVFFASLFAAFIAAHGSRRLIMSAGAALIMVLTGAAAVLGDRRSKTPVDVVAVPPPTPHTMNATRTVDEMQAEYDDGKERGGS